MKKNTKIINHYGLNERQCRELKEAIQHLQKEIKLKIDGIAFKEIVTSNETIFLSFD